MWGRLLKLMLVLLVVAAVAAEFGPIPAGGAKPIKRCPPMAPNCYCPMYYSPVLCGWGCLYGNPCIAKCAGWNVQRDCVPAIHP